MVWNENQFGDRGVETRVIVESIHIGDIPERFVCEQFPFVVFAVYTRQIDQQMLDAAFANELRRRFMQIRRIGIRILSVQFFIFIGQSPDDNCLWRFACKRCPDLDLRDDMVAVLFVRPQRDEFSRKEKRLEFLVDAVKIARDVTQTFGVRAVPVRIENDVVKVGRRFSFGYFPDPIACDDGFYRRFFEVPSYRILIGIRQRNREVDRFREVDGKRVVVVLNGCFHGS